MIPSTSLPIRVEALTTWDQLQVSANEWNRLSQGVPFRTYEWYRAWWKAYNGLGDLLILVARTNHSPVGILPCFVERRRPLGKVLRLIGSGAVCSDQQEVICSLNEAEARQVGALFARWLSSRTTSIDPDTGARTPGFCCFEMIELEGLVANSPVNDALRDCLIKRNHVCHDQPAADTWRILLPGSTNAYLEMLSKPSRRKVRTAWKQIDEGEVQVLFVQDEADFNKVWPLFVELHQRRRKSRGDLGCFAARPFGTFLRDVAWEYLRAGKLEFVAISQGSVPLSTELAFRGDSITFAYQIGINPDRLKDNPGWIANAALIRRAIEQGQVGFDLCRGEAEYKRHLGAKPCGACSWRIVPPRFRSQLWDATLLTQSAIKDWLKSGLKLAGVR